MKKSRYSNDDVEDILRTLAQHDRVPMDDAMTERGLAVIDAAVATGYRCYLRRKLARFFAAAAILGIALSLLLVDGGEGAPPLAKEHGTPPAPSARGEEEQRAFLRQLDCTTEAGFAPAPQAVYAGNGALRYGVSVQEKYDYVACSDTF